jgi:short subunit dehydrogenase-like uncharacterized protein
VPDSRSASPSTSHEFDIVVFGATGFVGRLIAAYLDRHAPASLRLAIAGRSADRLAELARGLQREVGQRIASVDDPASLAAMAGSTRVLLTTVGPYAALGEPVVAACVAAGTDYLDLTGEPAFVDRVRHDLDEAARASGSLVIHCCGFDSIPADLGVLFTIKQLPAGRPITITGHVEVDASASGGTFASALGALSERRGEARPRPPTQEGARVVRRLRERPHYDKKLARWCVPMPTIDPQIVLRSARARADYGPEFRYGHYLCRRSLPALAGTLAGVAAITLLAQTAPTRKLLQRLRPQGTGPDAETRRKSSYRLTFVATAGDAHVITEVSGGDPGYDETARMASETTLCLALQRDEARIPAGVETTAAALGEPLLARLIAAGMHFKILEGADAG